MGVELTCPVVEVVVIGVLWATGADAMVPVLVILDNDTPDRPDPVPFTGSLCLDFGLITNLLDLCRPPGSVLMTRSLVTSLVVIGERP